MSAKPRGDMTGASQLRRSDPTSGSFVGRYRLGRELGRGGTASVHAAVEITTGREVALKILERDEPAVMALFEREYHTLASFRHPRVIQVWDFGITSDGRRYYTMERLPGEDLTALAPLPWRDVCAHMRDVATTLQLLHARRLLHRDVSPRNIRIDASGRAKLIDFGTLTTFGIPRELAGTPACMAPEVVRNLPLDQRADLFSLGVVTYYALTGKRPFAIRHFADAELAYGTPPPPSDRVPDIPRALDLLVLSMLSLDPMSRPASAAEVIERFGTIAELDEAPLAVAAEHHLRSATFIGRRAELEQLSHRLRRAQRGVGSTVVIEGATGMGRSRMADEVLLEARLAGFIALRVDAGAHPEPGAVLRALCQSLLDLAPADAKEALGLRRRILAGAFPDVFERGSSRPPSVRPGGFREGADHWLELQEAVVGWMSELASRRPLLLIVDDAHLTDNVSAGALAALGRSATDRRLLLLLTRLTGADAPVAIEHLTRSATTVELSPLHADAVADLVASVFGDVPERARLAAWLRTTGHGNPGQSLELLRDLVDRGVIRYDAGAWVLPSELGERDLPASLEVALDARIAQLTPTALELAQLFGLHRGALTLGLASRLLPQVGRAELYRALDELLARDVAVCSGESYRLRQDALRSLLLGRLTPERTRALHGALARALVASCRALDGQRRSPDLGEASPPELALVLQAGFHFRRGGEDARGRALLRTASLELAHRGEGFTESIPVLEAALSDYVAEGQTEYERAYLMVPLTVAGFWADFRLSYRYGDELLRICLEVSGLGLAQKLSRHVGPRLALVLALPYAAVRFVLTRRRRSARTFREIILAAITMGSSITGTCAPLLDRERALRTLEALEALEGFPVGHPASIARRFQRALVGTIIGRFDETVRLANEVLDQLHRTRGSERMPDEALLQLVIGTHIVLGSLSSQRVDGAILRTYEELESIGSGAARAALVGAHASHAAHRGELREFEEWQREVDVLAAQAGSTWRQDVLLARNLWWIHVLSHDTLRLKHALRHLEKVSKEAPSMRDTYEATLACYLAERGQAAEALERFEPMFEKYLVEPNELGMRYIGAYARVLRKAGRAERARQVSGDALARLDPRGFAFIGSVLGAELEHARALSETGAHEEAWRFLDRTSDLLPEHDSPLVHGLTHECFASLALAAGHRERFEEHLALATSWFRRSENPALMALARRLSEEGRRLGMPGEASMEGVEPSADRHGVLGALASCERIDDRLRLALDLVVERAGAERGYLYLVEEGSVVLSAQEAGPSPPPELQTSVEAHLAHLTAQDGQATHISAGTAEPRSAEAPRDDGPPPRSPGPHRILALVGRQGSADQVVGAVVLVSSEAPFGPVEPELLREVAEAIQELGGWKTG